jgi:transketolase
VDAIDRAYAEAAGTAGQPTAIIARTMKGRGVAAVPPAEVAPRRTAHLANGTGPRIKRYGSGEMVATRTAFGEALAAVGDAREDVVMLDGEVSDSTKTDAFAQEHPDRFFEFCIAEQQMVAAALGLQARGFVPFVATFAAFLSRAYEANQTAALVAETAAGHGIGYLRRLRRTSSRWRTTGRRAGSGTRCSRRSATATGWRGA